MDSSRNKYKTKMTKNCFYFELLCCFILPESQREVGFRSKLSDAALADGNGQTLLSEHSDADSAHSNGSDQPPTPRIQQQSSMVKVSFIVINL